MSVSFLGLNSSFDSAALVEQLVAIETQNKVRPLETKRSELESNRSFLNSVGSSISSLQDLLQIEAIGDGDESLFPKSITSSDDDNEFVTVTAEDTAVSQTFDVTVSQLATNTVKKSANSVSIGINGASVLNTASYKGGATLSSGTVTINGETQTYTVDPATDDVNSMLTFLSSFTGITATLEANGHIKLDGVTNLGSSGDTSNLISALGLNNAEIVGGEVTGIQNIDVPLGSAKLSALGINGTVLTVNGTDISFDPAADSINDLVSRINTTTNAKVDASYDALNGELVLTNEETGALSLTLSSADSNIVTQLALTDETLGDNAEFTISTLNGGATLVSNDNSVSGLIAGVTLDLEKATTGPVTITIGDDKQAYKDKINEVLDEVNDLIQRLNNRGDSFSRGLSSQIKNQISTFFSGSTADAFKSGIEIGIKSSLDGDNKFSGFTLDETIFDAALDSNPAAVSTVLYGKTGTVVNALDDGSSGIFVLLNDLLDGYVDPDVPSEGIISQVTDSISNQINATDDAIERQENSIESLETRLRRDFTQLDLLNAEAQRQQAAVSGLFAA